MFQNQRASSLNRLQQPHQVATLRHRRRQFGYGNILPAEQVWKRLGKNARRIRRKVLSGLRRAGQTAIKTAAGEGYYCLPTAGGVAQATTRTVVKGSLAVLALNFVLTAFMVE